MDHFSFKQFRRILGISALAVALVVSISACGLGRRSVLVSSVQPGIIKKVNALDGAKIVVGSKDFTEQLILGQMVLIAMRAAGANPVDLTNIHGSAGFRQAMLNGQVDAGYDYTGTGWITYTGHTTPIPDRQKQFDAIKKVDVSNGIDWVAPPASLDNTYAFAMSQKAAKETGVKTISDIAKLAKSDPSKATFCVETEFASRNDGLPGVEKRYGFTTPKSNVRVMDTGIVYTQTAKGACNFGEVFTTDGRIKALNLKLVEDDKNFFPRYNVTFEARSDIMKQYPQLADVMKPVTNRLTSDIMLKLNAKVDLDGMDPDQVALDWMTSQGLVKS